MAFYCTAYSFGAATSMASAPEYEKTALLNALRHGALWNMGIKSEKHPEETRNAVAYVKAQSAEARERQIIYCANMARAIIGLMDAKEAAKLERATIAAYQTLQAKLEQRSRQQGPTAAPE